MPAQAAKYLIALAMAVALMASPWSLAQAGDTSGAYTSNPQPKDTTVDRGLTPEESNALLLNKAFLDRQERGFRYGDEDAGEEYSTVPPGDDTPAGGYKMLILDDQGRVTEIKTSN